MRFLTVLLLVFSFIPIKTVVAQQVVGGEYFVNSYVDFGEGTSFSLSSEATNLELDVASIPDGLNVLYIRTKTNAGVWSMTSKSVFYKYPAPQNIQVVEVEYFIDTYGNFGTGTKIQVSAGDYLIDLAGIQPGLHLLFVRVKDNAGKWSHTKSSAFYVADDELSKIVSLQYQFLGEAFESDVYSYTDFEPAVEVDLSQDEFLTNATGLEDGKNYKIKIIATNEKGQQSLTYTAYVRDKDDTGNLAEQAFEISSPTEMQVSFSGILRPSCPGDENGGLTVNATGGVGSYTYKLASGTNFQNANQFTDLPAGEYTVTVRDGNGCEKTATVQLTTQNQAPPVPTITIEGTDGISEEVQLRSSSALGNQWLRNGEEIPGATGQSLEITQSGNYEVKVTASSGCSATSATTVITSNASGEIRSGNPSMLFPNPATDQVRLKFEREFYLEKVTIINSQGILNNTLEIQRMTDEVVIEVAGLAPGKYFLFVEGVGLQERLNLIKR